jgi:hypothetical protein
MIKNPKDFKLGAGFALFCLLYLLVLIPMQVGSLKEEAALLPVLVALFLLILSLLLMARAIRRPSLEKKQSFNPKRMMTIAGVSIIMAAYAWLLDKTGFLLTSFLAMVLLFRVFGVKDYKRIAAIIVVTLICLYISFEKLLYAPLPVGSVFEALLD